ncbi:MAG TPA: VOC family protein [Opitutaceae bacterium]|jgi:lactoylglutathione lyase|nr:VOC family protein [Opitutaceae bacterium]
MKYPRLLLAAALAASALRADVARPKILGVAQAAYYVHDLAQARKFYCDFLGYQEWYTLTNPDGSAKAALIKIGDHQSLELVPEVAAHTDRFNHIALEVDDAEAMRQHLRSHGVEVADHITKGTTTVGYFTAKDPDGHLLEFVQYGPDSLVIRDTGKHMPATRISAHMSHAGIMVHNLAAAQAFYRDLLGCVEIWRGSGNGKTLSWVNMRVPDGTDWVEFMLYAKMPSLAHVGVSHHICLLVPDVAQAGAILKSRALPAGAQLSADPITGTDRKRQIHCFDPDGTRVEIMEAAPPDGIPAASSTAPPPAG